MYDLSDHSTEDLQYGLSVINEFPSDTIDEIVAKETIENDIRVALATK